MFNDKSVLFQFRGPFGISVQIGTSIIFLALFFVYFSGGMLALAYSSAFFGMVVLSIFLHELGHAWGCHIQRVPVRRIFIFGGGGFCEPARAPTRYQDELIVAMGPIVNLTIWAGASLLLRYMDFGLAYWALDSLALINLFLALLNLVPAQPLDGGKLFHLMLLRVTEPQRAMRIAGGVGVVICVLWIPAMIYCFMKLGLILFFIPPIRLHWQMFSAAA